MCGHARHGDLVLDDVAGSARRDARQLGLTPAEYRLPRHLPINAGQVLPKEQISLHVRGDCRATESTGAHGHVGVVIGAHRVAVAVGGEQLRRREPTTQREPTMRSMWHVRSHNLARFLALHTRACQLTALGEGPYRLAPGVLSTVMPTR